MSRFQQRRTCSPQCKGTLANTTRAARKLATRYAGVPLHVLPLAGGEIALIDEGDASAVRQHSWAARYDKRNTYAWTRIDGRWVLLHRFILKPDQHELVDHVNANGLDNRRRNLRTANRVTNAINRRSVTGKAVPYKGVTFHSQTGKWRAQIKDGECLISLGLHKTPEAAAASYDIAAREHFGAFARLNFPGEGEQAA